MSERGSWVARCAEAENRVEELERELEDLRARMRAVLGSDPTTASSALGWMTRARESEELVRRVLRHVDQRSLVSTDLPPGWVARAQAQMKSVEIAMRDQQLFTGPDHSDEFWEAVADGRGRPHVITRRRGE